MPVQTRLLQSLVNTRRIEPTEAFPEAQATLIEQMAQAIVALGASVRPLLILQLEFDASAGEFRYQVLGDHLAYWAAVRAREISPVAHEATQAWIVDEDQAAAALLHLAG